MIGPALFSSTAIPVLEQTVNFAQARHNVLAGNLANLDTPGYRVRDLSPEQFESKLRDAIEQRNQARSSRRSQNESSRPRLDDLSTVSGETRNILFHDLSDVSVERQVAEITKNQTRHNLALAIMTSQFRLLQTAISEKV